MYLYRLMRPLLTFVPNQLANNVLQLSTYLCDILRPRLLNIPPDILSLPPHLQETQPRDADGADKDPPAPIIPIMTSQPRPLSAFLYARSMNARPITWPTVPKGKDRVRVCLHAGNTRGEVNRLVDAMVEWAEAASVGMAEATGAARTFVGPKL
jgi:8-amino-7-oxononanoate synthase